MSPRRACAPARSLKPYPAAADSSKSSAKYKKHANRSPASKCKSTPPTGPSYQYAQGVLAAKIAYDKAAEAKGSFPTTEDVIAALEGLEFESISTTVKMALNNGHQAITEHMYGITKWDAENGQPVLTDVVGYAAECVMPPDGVNSVDWIEGGMQGAKC